MPKKAKCGKNSKTKGSFQEKRKLIEPDIDGQVYGILEKALGSRFFNVNCLDGVQRRCKVRSKRLKVVQGDVVIVSLREFDDKNGDVIYKYNSEEVRDLQKAGNLPTSELINIKNEEVDDDDCAFDFDDI